MGATAASCGSSPFIPRENSLAGYIKGFSKLVAQNQLEGILATAWDDGSPHSETVWRGYIAQGEYGWNPTARTVEAVKAAHAQREFGFHPNDNHMAFLDNQPTGSRRTGSMEPYLPTKNSPSKGGTKTI